MTAAAIHVVVILAVSSFVCSLTSRSVWSAAGYNCNISTTKSYVCTANDSHPFPLQLDKNTKTLVIEYLGHTGFKLTKDMMDHYPKLQALTLQGNLTEIEEGAFLDAKNIKQLIITKTLLREFPDHAFGNATSLKILRLNYNPMLSDIKTTVISSLTHVKYADFSYSGFPICDNSTLMLSLHLLRKLFVLNLAGLGQAEKCANSISGFLDSISHVKELILSDSGFVYEDKAILKPLYKVADSGLDNSVQCGQRSMDFSNLRSLDFSNHRFRSLPSFILGSPMCRFENVTKLDLSAGLLTYIPMNESLQLCRALSSIRSLDLSRNKISCMEALCPSLETLNLESNFIGTSHSSVSYEALKKLNMLTLLSMSGNRLTSIPYDMFDMMTQLQYLNLSNNFLTALDIYQFQHNSLLTLVSAKPITTV